MPTTTPQIQVRHSVHLADHLDARRRRGCPHAKLWEDIVVVTMCGEDATSG